MKKFTLKVFFFLLPVIVLGLALEILLRGIPNDYKIKREYLDRNASEIETLILGSSHSLYGINPKYFKAKSFNAALPAQTLKFDLEILKMYEDQFENLKYVILPISYASLFDNLREKHEWRVSYYVIYYGMSSPYFSDYSEVLSKKLNFNIKLFRNFISGKHKVLSSQSGWAEVFNSENQKNLQETGEEAAARHTHNVNQNFEENISILKLIVAFCERKGIKLFLYTPPSYKSYFQALDQNQLKLAIETTNEIAEIYDHVSYSNWLVDTTFISTDYYDADHLNKNGAQKLTLLIRDKIKN